MSNPHNNTELDSGMTANVYGIKVIHQGEEHWADLLGDKYTDEVMAAINQKTINELTELHDYWHNLGFRGEAFTDIKKRIERLKESK